MFFDVFNSLQTKRTFFLFFVNKRQISHAIKNAKHLWDLFKICSCALTYFLPKSPNPNRYNFTMLGNDSYSWHPKLIENPKLCCSFFIFGSIEANRNSFCSLFFFLSTLKSFFYIQIQITNHSYLFLSFFLYIYC